MSRLLRKFKTPFLAELRIAFFADFVIAIYAQDFIKGSLKKQEVTMSALPTNMILFKNV
jgi:hypothetical protein